MVNTVIKHLNDLNPTHDVASTGNVNDVGNWVTGTWISGPLVPLAKTPGKNPTLQLQMFAASELVVKVCSIPSI